MKQNDGLRPRGAQFLWPAWLILGGAGLGVALVLNSCATEVTRTVSAPPEIVGANYVGNTVCSECHQTITQDFPQSPHGRYYKEGDLKWAMHAGCESCHGAGSKHVAAGGGRGNFIVNPGKDAASCFQCHLDSHAEFRLPHHHPVVEGLMNCIQCHNPHGKEIHKPSGRLAMAGINATCAECHTDQARSFVFEHEAMREGCVTCHQPHGSINEKMLVQRDVNLCLRCHSQFPMGGGQIFIGQEDHSFHLRQGTCWTSGCHTAVHGSNVSPKLRF